MSGFAICAQQPRTAGLLYYVLSFSSADACKQKLCGVTRLHFP